MISHHGLNCQLLQEIISLSGSRKRQKSINLWVNLSIDRGLHCPGRMRSQVSDSNCYLIASYLNPSRLRLSREGQTLFPTRVDHAFRRSDLSSSVSAVCGFRQLASGGAPSQGKRSALSVFLLLGCPDSSILDCILTPHFYGIEHQRVPR